MGLGAWQSAAFEKERITSPRISKAEDHPIPYPPPKSCTDHSMEEGGSGIVGAGLAGVGRKSLKLRLGRQTWVQPHVLHLTSYVRTSSYLVSLCLYFQVY